MRFTLGISPFLNRDSTINDFIFWWSYSHGTKQKAHTCANASNSIYYMLQRAENEIHSYSN
jgi:hypothetical protein